MDPIACCCPNATLVLDRFHVVKAPSVITVHYASMCFAARPLQASTSSEP